MKRKVLNAPGRDIPVSKATLGDKPTGVGGKLLLTGSSNGKSAEEALWESEAFFSGAFEQAPIGMALVSMEGRWLKVNRALCEVFGYPEEELLTLTFQKLTHPDDLEQSWENVRRLLAGEVTSTQTEKRYVHKDGHFVSATVNISLVRDAQSQPLCFIGQIQDISERKRAETALKASEAELRNLAEAMPQIVWATRPDGWNTFLNHQWTEYTGLTMEEGNGHGWDRPFHPDDKPVALEAWRQAMATTGTYSVECRMLRKDGEYRWWLIRGVPQLDSSGRVLKWHGTCTDIHDMKLAELEISRTNQILADSEEKFRHLADNITDVFWMTSPDMSAVHYVSAGYESIWGRTIESLLEDPHQWVTAILPEERDHVFAAFGRLMESDAEVSVEYRIARPDGTVRLVLDRGFQVRDAGGKLIRLTGIVTDITERKAIEGALRKSEEQFREMLENVELIAMIVDIDAKVVFCNDFLLRVTGWEREEVTGTDLFERFFPESMHAELRAEFESVHNGVLPGHYETPIQTKSGELREVIWNNTILRDPSGKVTGVATIGEDITERSRATAALKQALDETEAKVEARTADLKSANANLQTAVEQADSANRAKSHFLSRMSHELRTPMNAILGFGQLLKLSELDKAQVESIDHILRGGLHLLGLINDVLEISTIEIGEIGISLVEVPLSEILASAVSLMRPIADESGIVLKLEDAPPIYVLADRQRLSQVVLNLLSNAIKYNAAGGSVSVCVVAKEPGAVSIEVSDTGLGISSEMQKRLFVPFDRLGADGRGIEGTGLGLSLSKSLVEAMGGALTFETNPGVGSCFRIRLTQAEPTALAPTAPHKEVSATKAASLKTVLSIEDNIANTELLERIFSKRPNVRLVAAMQGRLGLELAKRHLPDLILLDLHLPDMSGREVLLSLKSDPELKHVPVIVISADAFPTQAESLIEAGALRYLTKPFDIAALLSEVDTILASAPARA